MRNVLCYLFSHKYPKLNFFDGRRSVGLCHRCEQMIMLDKRGKWVIRKETNQNDFIRYYNTQRRAIYPTAT